MSFVSEDYRNFIKECGISAFDEFINAVDRFRKFIEAENNQYNLTRIIDKNEFWCKHVCDSLSIIKYFPELLVNQLEIIDIGCGAGFPSFMLALAYPNLNITAIDSIRKKIVFLEKAVELFAVTNFRPIHIRSKEMKPLSKYDVITARAVAEPIKIFRESKKLLKDSGRYILYKTPQEMLDKIDHLNKLTEKQSFFWEATEVFKLPDGSERLFLIGERKNGGF